MSAHHLGSYPGFVANSIELKEKNKLVVHLFDENQHDRELQDLAKILSRLLRSLPPDQHRKDAISLLDATILALQNRAFSLDRSRAEKEDDAPDVFKMLPGEVAWEQIRGRLISNSQMFSSPGYDSNDELSSR